MTTMKLTLKEKLQSLVGAVACNGSLAAWAVEEILELFLKEKTVVANECIAALDDINNYDRILALLGMQEEGDPVAWVEAHLAKGAQEWRPIETAPRNRMVMLGRPNDDDYEGISLPGFWNESLEDGVDYMGNDEGFVDCMYSTFYCGRSFGNPAYQNAGFQPTHWMPLPAAPMLSQRGEVR